MGARSSTFTSYINAELDPGVGRAYDDFARIGETSFGRIARAAKTASDAQSAIQARINASVGTGRSDAFGAGAARASASAFVDLERRAFALRSALDPMVAVQGRVNSELAEARSLLNANAISTTEFTAREAQLRRELDASTVALRRHTDGSRRTQAAVANLGQQFGDLTLGLASGINPGVVFAQQIGQIGYAVGQMGGRLTGLAAFLNGSWGAALTAGAIVAGILAGKLFETKEAADQVKYSIDALGNAQSILGSVLDIQTGKVLEQATAYRALAVAQLKAAEIESQTKAADARRSLQDFGARQFYITGGLGGGLSAGFTPEDTYLRGLGRRAIGGSDADREQIVRELDDYRRAGRLSSEAFNEAAAAVGNYGAELANLGRYQAADRMLARLGTAADRQLLLRPARTKSSRSASDRLDEFGRDTADRLASLRDQFDDTPDQLRRVQGALRQVDDLIDDLISKKPPNFQTMIASARDVRGVIAESVTKPYTEFLGAQRQALDYQRLLTAGRGDEAEALRVIEQLERRMGPLTPARRDAVLATVQALRQEQRQTEILHERSQKYLTALSDIRSSITDTLAGGLRDIGSLPSRLRQTFNRLSSEYIVDRLFGDTFRKLEDRITGEHVVEDAAERAADAFDQAAASVRRLGKAAAGATPGTPSVGGTPLNALAAASNNGDLTGIVSGFGALARMFSHPAPTSARSGAAAAGLDAAGEIVVTGSRYPRRPADFMAYAITELAGQLVSPKAAKLIGGAVGDAFQGVGVGSIASGFAKALGIKQSGTGAALGGAIGGIFGGPVGGAIGGLIGGPVGGSILGGLIGGTLGGLFGKTKKGTATLGLDAFGQLGVTGTGGNSSSLIRNATGLAGTVADQLSQIADQLGGGLGSLSVSIGQRKKKFVVDPTGAGRTKGSGVLKFEDEADAINAAIQDAINDGVITGISAASQRILKSGQDLTRALNKATAIESIPKRLLQLTDPVRYAVTELNDEFTKLIGYLREGGATTEQYAEAQKLYDIERAKAIEEATSQAASAIDSYLKEMLGGSTSPLSRRATYNNAAGAFQAFEGDVAAGRAVDSDRLLEAARNFQDASRTLYGSSQSFFGDYNEVQSILTKAQANSTGASAGAALPGSPFDTAEVQRAIAAAGGNQVAATNAQTNVLVAQLQEVNARLAAIAAAGGTSGAGLFASLPGFG